MKFRIGHGYDIHQLEESHKPFLLAGVSIATQYGIVAHSDGDILIHALVDAILGAASLGDIGKHFPDTDIHNKNIAGKTILQQVMQKISAHGWQFNNADITLVLETPKLSKYIPDIITNLQQLLECDQEQINVKATTNEQCDAVGTNKAIAAFAVASLIK